MSNTRNTEYRTPRACYSKAPVRRETWQERHMRVHRDQIPPVDHMIELLTVPEVAVVSYTINADLIVTGPGYFVKDPTR